MSDPVNFERLALAAAVEAAVTSPCRSKRGVVIFDEFAIIAAASNSPPVGFVCDASDRCRASCSETAVHAEQRALLRAGLRARGASMLHVKVVDGQAVASGGPSCIQCSKLVLEAGIAEMWLLHEDGLRRYGAAMFHELSLASKGLLEVR